MTKITFRWLLSLLVITGFAFNTNAQYLTEDFEGGDLPTGWSLEYVSGTHDWVYQNGDGGTSPAHGGTMSAAFEHTSTGSATKLNTLDIDLSGATNPQLNFWHVQKTWGTDQDQLRVFYRISALDPWVLLEEWTSGITSWQEETIDLPNPSATYAIAFEATDDYGYGVAIDDISVLEAPSCPAPMGQTASNITANEATLSWISSGTETDWEVEYGVSGFIQGAGTTVTVTDTFANISLLMADTDHDFYVRAVCAAGDESTWVGAYAFQTMISCPAPTGLTSSMLTPNSATVSWNAGAMESNWLVEYGVDGFTQGTGTTVAVTDTFANISALLSTTDYEFYIRAVCGPGDSSTWVGSGSFTTLCEVISTFPHLEDFTTFVPNCWDEAGNGLPSEGPLNVGSGDWKTSTFPGGDAAVNINLFNNVDKEWVRSPQFDLSATTYQVELDVAVTDYNSSNPATMGSDDKVILLITEDGTTWDTLNIWDAADNLSNSANHFTFELNAYSSTASFAIWGTDGSINDSEDYDFYFDNFLVREIPNCPEPTALTASNITANEATLSWISSGTETDWEVEYGVSGFIQGTGTTVAVTDTFANISLLMADTDHDFYVRAVCGTDDESTWVGAYAFQTMISCPAPTGLTSSMLTPNSATVSWNAGAMESNWLVEYGEAGFTQNTGTTVAATDTFTNISSLTPETEYEFYVRAVCGPGDSSTWVGSGSFTTLCEVISTFPHLEDFTTFVPNCWDEAGSGDPTTGPDNLSSGPWIANTFPGGDSDAKINLYNVSHSDWVLSPEFDLSASAYQVELDVAVTDFSNSNPGDMGSDDKVILLITEDETTWDTLKIWSAADNLTNSANHFTFDLTAYTSNASFSIWATDGSVDDLEDYDFHFDNFLVREIPNCPEPTDLTASDITSNSTIFSWIKGAMETDWEVEYGELGFTHGAGTTVAVTDTFATISFLTADTDYEFYVRAVCGAGDESIWAGSFPFQTTVSCPAPTGQTTSMHTFTSATLSWIKGAFETNWEVEYGEVGFTQGTGTTVAVTDTFTNISSLTAETEYEFYVRAVCGAGDESDWVGAYSFLTGYCLPSSTASGTYIDDFSTTNGAANISNLGSGHTAGGYFDGSTQYVESFETGTFDFSAIIVGGSAGFSMWIDWNNDLMFDNSTERVFNTTGYSNGPFTGTVSVPLGTPQGDYKMRITTDYNDSNPDDPCADRPRAEFEDYTITISAPPSCLAPNNLMTSNISSSSATLSWFANGTETEWEVEYGLTGFIQGAGTIVAATDTFSTISSLTSETDYEFYVRAICGAGDESTWEGSLSFQTAISCPAPSALVASNITTTSATISWVSGGSSNYNVQYGLEGFILGTEATIALTDTFYNASALTHSTNYDFYVQDSCGLGDVSTWVGPFTFSTVCEYVNSFPYFESFEGSNMPICWTVLNEDGDTKEFIINTDEAHEGSQSTSVNFNASGNDDWLISPQFDITQSDLVLEFAAKSRGTFLESYNVLISTTGNAPADFTVVLENVVDAPNTWEEKLYNLADHGINNGDQFYVAIQCVSVNEFTLYIDAFSLHAPYSSDAAITSYVVPGQDDAVIDAANNSIMVTMPVGNTYPITLAAEFALSANATAAVATVPQASTVTENTWVDNSTPVVYNVTAEDGTTMIAWSVYVDIDLAVNNVIDSKDVTVYPNPNTGEFNIAFNLIGVKTVNIEILNVQGQVIRSFDNMDSNKTQTIDLSEQSEGMYFVRISSENETVIKKVNIIK